MVHPNFSSRLPRKRIDLALQASYTLAEMGSIQGGLMPESMDDHWRIQTEDQWLIFRRSWTGLAIFGILLERTANGCRVSHAWVNGNRTQYRTAAIEYEREFLRCLIDSALLFKKVRFPIHPADAFVAPTARDDA